MEIVKYKTMLFPSKEVKLSNPFFLSINLILFDLTYEVLYTDHTLDVTE